MNKKVNLYLNITGFASFLLSFLLIFISLKLEASTGILIYLGITIPYLVIIIKKRRNKNEDNFNNSSLL